MTKTKKSGEEMGERIRITIVSNYYYPDVASIANLYKQLAEYLSKEMEVTVLCSVPCYLGEIPEEYKNGKVFISDENHVRVIRLGVPNYDKSSKLSRIKSLFFFITRSIAAHKFLGEQDVILAVSQPPVFGGYIGYRLKKRTKAKFIYNIQDFNPEQMEYSGFSKNRFILKSLKKLDNFLCRRADGVITVSEDMRKTLCSRMNGVSVPANYVINNWVDTSVVKNVPKCDNQLVSKYGINASDFLVVYAGNIGVMQKLQSFLCAADMLRDHEDIKFIFIGAGAWLPDMRRYIEEHNMQNILLKPYEPIENIDLVYSLGDVEVVSIGKNVTKCSMPSKTWNILSCGVPVICQVDPESELNTLINDNEIGVTVAPDDPEEIAGKLLELYSDPELRRKMGVNARKLAVEQFDYKVSVEKYREIIQIIARE